MQFTIVSLLGLVATAVHAAPATLEERACIDYVGNSWGCSAPAGFASNWNYCQAVNPDYPVRKDLTPFFPLPLTGHLLGGSTSCA